MKKVKSIKAASWCCESANVVDLKKYLVKNAFLTKEGLEKELSSKKMATK